MSWSAFISGDLVRELWENEVSADFVRFKVFNGQDGTNTFSESPEPSRLVVNASDDASELSSWQTEELLLVGIMALQQATEAAYRVRVREVWQPMFNQEAPTTPAKAPVSPFTQRLTHYSNLIGEIAQELRSIAPTSPVTDATDSSKAPESSSSSLPEGHNCSHSEYVLEDKERFPLLKSHAEEPPFGSIVLDPDGDVWQRTYDDWCCAYGGSNYAEWTWERLSATFRGSLRLVYKSPVRLYCD